MPCCISYLTGSYVDRVIVPDVFSAPCDFRDQGNHIHLTYKISRDESAAVEFLWDISSSLI